MFEYVVKKNGLREEEARWFFQQLIVGLDYCHRMVSGVLNSSRHTGGVAAIIQPCDSSQQEWSSRQWGSHIKLAANSSGCGSSASQHFEGQSSCCSSLYICWAAALYCATPAHVLCLPSIMPGRCEPRHQAGEHAAGQQPAASGQNLRLWLLQGKDQSAAAAAATSSNQQPQPAAAARKPSSRPHAHWSLGRAGQAGAYAAADACGIDRLYPLLPGIGCRV